VVSADQEEVFVDFPCPHLQDAGMPNHFLTSDLSELAVEIVNVWRRKMMYTLSICNSGCLLAFLAATLTQRHL
jgi:hypothetical protein